MGVPRICSHQQVDDHHKERKPHDRTYNKQKGKLEWKIVYHTVTGYFTVQAVYVNQTCYDFSTNTLRL